MNACKPFLVVNLLVENTWNQFSNDSKSRKHLKWNRSNLDLSFDSLSWTNLSTGYLTLFGHTKWKWFCHSFDDNLAACQWHFTKIKLPQRKLSNVLKISSLSFRSFAKTIISKTHYVFVTEESCRLRDLSFCGAHSFRNWFLSRAAQWHLLLSI